MTGKIYHPEDKHPEPYEQDLNPDAGAGINYGTAGPHPERHNPPTAFDVKDLHDRLRDFGDDVLKRIPVLPTGARLEEGAVYVDLHNPAAQEFRAYGGMEAGCDNWYVPKDMVDFQVWNRLIGVNNPERTGGV